jgi:hypothetical protein
MSLRLRTWYPGHSGARGSGAGAALVAIALLVSSCGRKVEARVRDGDIIFQTSQSEQSRAIQLATHSPYSHMGLVLFREGRPFVFEAVSPSVRFTPLREWIARGEGARYVVKRLRDSSVLADPNAPSALTKAATALAGRPYDPYFEWSDDRVYCSELVWKAYERGLGVRLGLLLPLVSFDLTSPVVKAKLAERYGDKVPLDERVIPPASIFNSSLLQEVP